MRPKSSIEFPSQCWKCTFYKQPATRFYYRGRHNRRCWCFWRSRSPSHSRYSLVCSQRAMNAPFTEPFILIMTRIEINFDDNSPPIGTFSESFKENRFSEQPVLRGRDSPRGIVTFQGKTSDSSMTRRLSKNGRRSSGRRAIRLRALNSHWTRRTAKQNPKWSTQEFRPNKSKTAAKGGTNPTGTCSRNILKKRT